MASLILALALQTAVSVAPAKAFWRAYDQLPVAKTADDSARIIFQLFENEGTPGHDEFMQVAGSAFDYVEHLKLRKEYYAWWRKHVGALDTVPAIINRTVSAFQKLVPGSKAPSFVVSVGRLNTTVGAADSSSFVTIGIDRFLPAYSPPTDDLREQQEVTLRPFSDLQRAAAIGMVLHNRKTEFKKQGEELLSEAINAGVEEVLTELVTGAPWASGIIAYGNANEAALWREFQADRAAKVQLPGRWFGPATRTRPGLLGRFVGYRIAKLFVELSPNRTNAIRRLLAGGDPLEILAVSRYEK